MNGQDSNLNPNPESVPGKPGAADRPGAPDPPGATGTYTLICPQCQQPLPADKQICGRDGYAGVERVPTYKIAGYEFIDMIGAGGMGVVYRARHVGLDKLVAVKCLPPGVADKTAMLRFFSEAKAMSKLNHPNIVQIHDYGLLPSGAAFMVLDYIKGITVQQFVTQGKRISLSEFLNVFKQCADALQHAHAQKTLHRDIKPANIMLSGKPFEVTILDFGIAKIQEQAERRLDLTRTGEIVGSPLYLSPESIKGEELDGATDIYSLGCVMYEVLAGHSPFQRGTVLATISSHLSDPTPALPKEIDFGPQVIPIISKCLEKDPKKRFKSMADLQGALKAVGENGISSGARSAPTKSMIVALSTGICCLAAVLLIVFKSQQGADNAGHPEPLKPSTTAADQGLRLDTDSFDGLKLIGSMDPTKRLDSLLSRPGNEHNLNLYQMELEDENLKKVAALKDLTILNLDNNHITDVGLLQLVKLPLTVLHLNRVPITDAGLLTISQIKRLHALELNGIGNGVTDRGLIYLARLPDLRSLCIDDNNITDVGAKVVGGMKSLRLLSLSRDFITDDGLPALASLPELQNLNLSYTHVTAEGMRILAKSKSLKWLVLLKTSVTDEVFEALKYSNIFNLDLSGTEITDDGLARVPLMKGLTVLKIENCHLFPQAIQRLKSACPQLNVVTKQQSKDAKEGAFAQP